MDFGTKRVFCPMCSLTPMWMNGRSETESVCTDFANLTKRDQPQPVREVDLIAILDECVFTVSQTVPHVFKIDCEWVNVKIHLFCTEFANLTKRNQPQSVREVKKKCHFGWMCSLSHLSLRWNVNDWIGYSFGLHRFGQYDQSQPVREVNLIALLDECVHCPACV